MKKKDFFKKLAKIFKKKSIGENDRVEMSSKIISQKNYIDKIKKIIPKNLIIEGISDKKIHIASKYLKSRKKLGFNFIKLSSHFGDNWNYEKYPIGNIMRNTNNNAIVGFMATTYSRRQINNKKFVCCNLAHFYLGLNLKLPKAYFCYPSRVISICLINKLFNYSVYCVSKYI